MYSIKLKGLKHSIKRGKGISKSIVKRLKHKTYKKVLKDQTFTKVNMTILKSKHHNVATTTFSKRALSAWEDKRCWMSTNYSLPHGHPDTQVPPPKRPRLCLPPSGDVESCMDWWCALWLVSVSAALSMWQWKIARLMHRPKLWPVCSQQHIISPHHEWHYPMWIRPTVTI